MEGGKILHPKIMWPNPPPIPNPNGKQIEGVLKFLQYILISIPCLIFSFLIFLLWYNAYPFIKHDVLRMLGLLH